MDIYNFEVKDPGGKKIDMKKYKGKWLLIVNTATKCGLAPQFEGLEALHQKYKEDGLEILGFPCNQFLNQEPETNETMMETCKLNFGVTFPLTEKIMVNGKNTHPAFRYLKKSLKAGLTGRIKWNFTKFLINPEGKPVKRFSPTTSPDKIEAFLQQLWS